MFENPLIYLKLSQATLSPSAINTIISCRCVECFKMSNIYIKEPSTNGKVLLHTSMGDIDVELWSKEAPLACRNFVQLCMEGYYNNVIFHRIVPGFIVQGGDPTGTGEGGDSVYGKTFKDEFHTRLRFVRRGLVAMANAGSNDNGSQFFFTLGPCNDLNKKHTIFGKVAGETIYNLVRLGEVGTTDDERPINPPFIKWTKVLANPFEDIVPRTVPDKDKNEKKKKKSQMKATKDFKLLSFGEEAEEEEMDVLEFRAKHNTKGKSSHDLANDPKLSSEPAIPDYDAKSGKRKAELDTSGDKVESDGSSSDDDTKKERLENVKSKLQTKRKVEKRVKIEAVGENEKDDSLKSEELRKESRQLAREILKSRRGADKNEDEKGEEKSDDSDQEDASNPLFADFKKQQKIYKEKTAKFKQKGSTREEATLALLNGFKQKLETVRKEAGWNEDEMEDPPDDDDGGDDDSGWMLHRLKHTDEKRDAKDVNRTVTEDTYDIHDPRNTINQRRRETSKKPHKDKDKTERRHHDRHDRHRSDRHKRR
uniref:spliceosome-associated protein CWC27 homolog n=1 Tax=Ciona intestinalis TaxID=7719 RepID=UPI00089DA9E1|nr:spliceosome-associated protein CWC27 homolog [Ciona intestinalis]|eukprot:XP_009862405.2 spliceosome-associated protein CWC27 homolog [Ciona intestinalis]